MHFEQDMHKKGNATLVGLKYNITLERQIQNYNIAYSIDEKWSPCQYTHTTQP